MITGIKKKNKLTEIWFDEIGSAVNIRTYNTDLKNRLTAYAAKYPAHCRLTDDDECGCLTFAQAEYASPYVWLPIEWQGDKPTIRWQDACPQVQSVKSRTKIMMVDFLIGLTY